MCTVSAAGTSSSCAKGLAICSSNMCDPVGVHVKLQIVFGANCLAILHCACVVPMCL